MCGIIDRVRLHQSARRNNVTGLMLWLISACVYMRHRINTTRESKLHQLHKSGGEVMMMKVTLTSDLQEVITNEHVVAMMKAAINETDAVPPFVSACFAGARHCLHSASGLFTEMCFRFCRNPK